MKLSICTAALMACVALPVWAADPVAKESGSRAKELVYNQTQARPVQVITQGMVKRPVVPRQPEKANAGQPPTPVAAEPGAPK